MKNYPSSDSDICLKHSVTHRKAVDYERGHSQTHIQMRNLCLENYYYCKIPKE